MLATRARTAAWLAILLACGSRLSALNPALDVNQYAHAAWTIREGFFSGGVTAIAQTPDGYLWVGTESGLFRFDGLRAIAWHPGDYQQLAHTAIAKLLVTRDGRLWIGTFSGLASWKDGRLISYPELAGQLVDALTEDAQGTVWAGTIGIPNGRLCAIRGTVQCIGQGGGLGNGVFSLYEDHGTLWVGAATGLWRWTPGTPARYATPTWTVLDMIKRNDGPLLLATTGGVQQFAGETFQAYPLSGVESRLGARRLLRDGDGSVWIGTQSRGLLHVHQGRVDLFTPSQGLSGDSVSALYEDREGNIWVGTNEGLDRFRELAVSTVSRPQGFPTGMAVSVLPTRDGSVWVGSAAGVTRWKDGRPTVYRTGDGLPDDRITTLFEDSSGRLLLSTFGGMAMFDHGRFARIRALSFTRIIYNIVEQPAGSFWLTAQQHGLIHFEGEDVVARIPWSAIGHDDHATALVGDPARNGLWIGFYNGGIALFSDGAIRASYGAADGLGAGRVAELRLDGDGVVWAATAGGLSRVTEQGIATLTTKNGLPCDAVHSVLTDPEGSRWLLTSCGLVRIRAAEWAAWVANGTHVVESTVFDSADGVRTQMTPIGFTPTAAWLPDGRLWFATPGGIGVLDPAKIPVNTLPPPVHVEQIVADHKTYDRANADGRVPLPPLVHDLQIDYTALSLTAPDKVRFRYKLDGVDPDWRDVGQRRQAFYTDLPPRQYRFRVAAANNSGVWNEAGAFLDFSIAPAYYQTTWFRAAAGVTLVALLWALHQLRLRQVAHEFNLRLDERVTERTRIARELHDTLLQSFQGLMLRFQGARDLLPADPAQAVEALDGALERADQAIVEGRDAIQNLRSSTTVSDELAQAIATLGEELTNGAGGEKAAMFRVSVEGSPRDLHPIVRDDIHRIAREALRNAFRHAHADRIEAEVTYAPRELRLRIRDDGKGIDPQHLSTGRARHWGLASMRERSLQIGAQLNLWSEVGAGTEVELRIPGAVAYSAPGRQGGVNRVRGEQGGGS
jgi:signal transduction histidine kinase/ligand-binding sensor domain-containing protein